MKISMGSLFWSFYAWCYDSLTDFRPYITLLKRVIERINLGALDYFIKSRMGVNDIFKIVKKYLV